MRKSIDDARTSNAVEAPQFFHKKIAQALVEKFSRMLLVANHEPPFSSLLTTKVLMSSYCQFTFPRAGTVVPSSRRPTVVT